MKYIIIMAEDRTAIRRVEVHSDTIWKPGDTYYVENKKWIVGTPPCNAKQADAVMRKVDEAIQEEWKGLLSRHQSLKQK